MQDEFIDILSDDEYDVLMHYGMPRRSGRFPYGSGEDPYQHESAGFLGRVQELKKKGITAEADICKELGVSSTKFRSMYKAAKDAARLELVNQAQGLRDKGKSLNEIARIMGYANDSSVRSLLNENAKARTNAAMNTANELKRLINEKGMLDVGKGVERELGVSKQKLEEALYILEQEGYPVYKGRMQQVTNKDQFTTMKVLCPQGTEYKEIYDTSKINSVKDYTISYDGGDSFRKPFYYPSSLDSKRLAIRYAEDGGVEKDGMVEIRRGVKDLSLGESNYAQVRIMVDGTHYIKGMATYSDDLPDGVDVLFNTNKTKDKSKMEVLKKIKDDPNNPFGSLIKEHGGQSFYDDPKGEFTDPLTGKKQSLSKINKRSDEGDWDEWGDTLPSQFLGKQPIQLIKRQLQITKDDKKSELDEIMTLENPVVKKKLLQDFAEDCDAAAVSLKAAALPRQRWQVILPMKTLKDDEIYAPNFENGETVALVRYPHGGTFEIPIVKVNNKNKEGIDRLTTTPKDAVGINAKVAERLSGADFDGDTVMVIPMASTPIKNKQPLQGLIGFDPKHEYPAREGMIPMTQTNKQMGIISNLISDMTIQGATDKELERAVKHSMVVIDAEKHHLDWKKSESDNAIAALKAKYQPRYINELGEEQGGAHTLLSKAKGTIDVLKRQGSPRINQIGKPWYDSSKPEGALVYNEVREEYVDKKGKTKVRTTKVTRMSEVSDARLLSSGTPVEEAYADYANYMKSMANTARKEMVYTPNIKMNKEAKEKYKPEVTSLKNKVDISMRQKPKERKAQAIANDEIKRYLQQEPTLANDKKEFSKLQTITLKNARASVGAKRIPVEITPKEWEAIQSGAVSSNLLSEVLMFADMDKVRAYATPRTNKSLSSNKISRIKSLAKFGYTNAEIAKAIGCSVSTVSEYL